MSPDATSSSDGTEVTTSRRRKRRRRRSSGHDRPRRVDRLVQAERVVAIAAVAAVIFFHWVYLDSAGGLWRDEVNGVNTAAAASIGELWRLAEFESMPVPMLLALRAWIGVGLGASDFTLRLFGLVSGLALPAAAWFALRRLTRSAPLVCLAILAVNPDVVRWSSTVRGWGVGAALAVVSMVLVREASVALTRRRITFAVIAAILAVQTQYQNVALLVGIVAAAAAVATTRRRWAEAGVPIGIGAMAVLTLLPYGGIFERRAAWNALGEMPVTIGDLLGHAWELGSTSGTLVLTCSLALLAMGLIAAVQWIVSPDVESVNRSRRGVATYAAAAAILSAGALAVFYRLLAHPTQPWYYVGIASFVVVCAEVAVASAAAARMARTALVVLATVVLVAGAPFAWTALREPHTNVDHLAARLNAEAAPGDVVVISPWFLATTVSRYYKGSASLVTIPPIDDVRVHRYDLVKAAMLETDPMARALPKLQHALESGHQVWVVGSLGAAPGASGARLPPPPLPHTGWNAAPYLAAWAREVNAFLSAHALEAREVPVGLKGGRFEDVGLAALKGWK